MNKYPNAPWTSPSDPFREAEPFLLKQPKWIILGGLGTELDFASARKMWPSVNLLGVEPDPRAWTWQYDHGWPQDAPLLDVALSYEIGTTLINMSDVNCASMHQNQLAPSVEGSRELVKTTTLDVLDQEYGFEDAIIWLDLEDWDYQALRGGKNLLASGKVLMVNFEARIDNGSWNRAAAELLEFHGFRPAWVWFQQWWGHNEIWVPRSKP